MLKLSDEYQGIRLCALDLTDILCMQLKDKSVDMKAIQNTFAKWMLAIKAWKTATKREFNIIK